MNRNRLSILIALLVISTLLVGSPVVAAQGNYLATNNALDDSNVNLPPDNSSIGTPKSISLGDPGTSFSYLETFGYNQAAYFDDSTHLNFPVGLAIDQNDNVYIFEELGKRMLKYDSSGVFQFKIGIAGLEESSDYNFSNPQDGIVDSNNNIWVAESNRVVAYTSAGEILLQIPEIVAWQSGTENGRFNHVTGVAFDSLGRLYVSDCNNQRIQVFDFDTEGNPEWIYMFGETEVSGNDNLHFNYPQRIAIQNDQLFVADSENHRIQVFDVSNIDPTLFAYLATIGTSGEPGDDNDHLGYPFGVAANDDFVAISEGNNNRIQIYNRSDLQYLTTAITGGSDPGYTWNPRDVAFDSVGNLYIADSYNHRVELFSKQAGVNWIYNRMFGTTIVPYLTDNFHFNFPRVAIDSNMNLIVIEELGQRLSKFDSNGTLVFSIGTPGIERDPNRGNNDNQHFNLPHGVVVDDTGKIYVADNSRVQIYSPAGVYEATIGADWSWGSGDYEFSWVAGLAVSPDGFIYVADGHNHRVQIYDSSYTYVGTLGQTGVSGADNSHFNFPLGVVVDSYGNIFVADTNNCRVQKFDSDRIYQMTFGTCGNYDNQIGNVYAENVNVDSLGRVYIANIWMNRVDVFDQYGAYLTTVGGAWGTNTSQFRGASVVAVDTDGFVYVSDLYNHRIQKFAPGYPDWTQININGFGEISNQVITSLQTFNNQLYAGTYNPETGGQIWLMAGDGSWSRLTGDGFGNPYNVGINHLMGFDGKLYASTWANETEGGELWRINSPVDWSRVVNNGFGDPTNGEIWHLTEFNDQVYATTWSYTDTHGAEIWRSSSGDQGSWSQVVSNGFNNDVNNETVLNTAEFGGYLYAGTRNSVTGGELWRSSSGANGSWNQVNQDGFGEGVANTGIVLTVFDNMLYAGTSNPDGGQIWRSTNGIQWAKVSDYGFGNADNSRIDNLFVYDGQLIAVTINNITGMEVWTSTDGITWETIAVEGFGDSNNRQGFWSHASTIYNNQLVLGTNNSANAGKILRYEPAFEVYLPLLLR